MKTFFEELSHLNRNNTPLIANSFYLIDDAKQRDKMTEEFYWRSKRRSPSTRSGPTTSSSLDAAVPSTMERWVVKIQALEEKKGRYEDILRRELSGLDDEFQSLRCFLRSCPCGREGLRTKKAA